MASPITTGNCIERGISTMRLALGYGNALPDGWEFKSRDCKAIVEELPNWFPGRKMIAAVNELDRSLINWPYSVQYVDQYELDALREDYLLAFAYYDAEKTQGHLVIGVPIYFKDMPMNIGIRFGVSLEEIC